MEQTEGQWHSRKGNVTFMRFPRGGVCMRDIWGGCMKGLMMRHYLLICLTGIAIFFATSPLSATPTQVPPFNEGDIVVGIQSNSTSFISLSGSNGPDNNFSGVHLTAGLADGKSNYFTWAPSGGGGDNNDCDGKDSDGKSCKGDCDDKDSDGKGCGDDDGHKHVTPEPASIMLLGTGLVVLGGIVRRKLVS